MHARAHAHARTHTEVFGMALPQVGWPVLAYLKEAVQELHILVNEQLMNLAE